MGLLIKGVNETIEKEAKEQKVLSANLMVNMLPSKRFTQAGEGTIKAGEDN